MGENMLNYYNNLVVILINILVSIIIILIYDFIKNQGKLYLNIYKMKVNVLNKNNWQDENNKTNEFTKSVELNFILQIFNNKNNYNSVYNFDVYKKKKLKLELIENHYLNLIDTMKSMSGTTTYEKFKYTNLLPYEVKEFNIKIKLTKEEFNNITKEPIYIMYKSKKRNKKIKINKFIKGNKKK